jgi:hypothetical protein
MLMPSSKVGCFAYVFLAGLLQVPTALEDNIIRNDVVRNDSFLTTSFLKPVWMVSLADIIDAALIL